MKVEIKLHPDLVKQGLGFTDTNGKQELRHKEGETLIVERTPFVNLKIQSGEITLIKTIENDPRETMEKSEDVKNLEKFADKVNSAQEPAKDDKGITVTLVETEEEKKKAKK